MSSKDHSRVKVAIGIDLSASVPLIIVCSAQKLWAGTVKIHPNAKTGAHHHGHLESVIYVVKGKARMRWGDKLQFTAEAGPGDFIYVPPYVPHQEINAKADEELECVLMRSDDSAIAINIPDLVPVEDPENVSFTPSSESVLFSTQQSVSILALGRLIDFFQVKWVDPTHPTGGI